VLEFAKAGSGIAFMSSVMVRDALEEKSLVRLLPRHAGADAGVHAVFLTDPQFNPKVRALIDFLVALLKPL